MDASPIWSEIYGPAFSSSSSGAIHQQQLLREGLLPAFLHTGSSNYYQQNAQMMPLPTSSSYRGRGGGGGGGDYVVASSAVREIDPYVNPMLRDLPARMSYATTACPPYPTTFFCQRNGLPQPQQFHLQDPGACYPPHQQRTISSYASPPNRYSGDAAASFLSPRFSQIDKVSAIASVQAGRDYSGGNNNSNRSNRSVSCLYMTRTTEGTAASGAAGLADSSDAAGCADAAAAVVVTSPYGRGITGKDTAFQNISRHESKSAIAAAHDISTGSKRLSTAKRSAATLSSGGGLHGHHSVKSDNQGSWLLSATSATAAAAAAMDDEACSVAAVIHNGKKEVGAAFCAFPSLTVSVTQFGDTCTYSKTLALLHAHNPVEVIVAASAVEDAFTQTLIGVYGREVTFTSVQRRFFQAEEGVERLTRLHSSLSPSYVASAAASVEPSSWFGDVDRYLGIAAANALLAYVEHINDTQLLPGSVRVRWIVLEDYADISRSSARALHIIAPANPAACAALQAAATAPMGRGNGEEGRLSTRSGRDNEHWSKPGRRRRRFLNSSSSGSGGGAAAAQRGVSASQPGEYGLRTTILIDALPRACTCMGQRFLRTCILQPLRDPMAIQHRHDAVEWLTADATGRRQTVLRGQLQRLRGLDVEKMVACIAQYSAAAAALTRGGEATMLLGDIVKGQYLLQSMLLLWEALDSLASLEQQLSAQLGPLPLRSDAAASAGGKDKNEGQADGDHDSASRGYLRHRRRRRLDDGGDEDAEWAEESKCRDDVEDSVSSPEDPALLRSIAKTLRECDLSGLSKLLETYLDRAVRDVMAGTAAVAGGAGGGEGRARQSGMAHCSDTPFGAFNGVATRRPTGMKRQRTTTAASRALPQSLRVFFAVKTGAKTALDVARSGFTYQVERITHYVAQVKSDHQIYSLQLEADAAQLYCLSYAASDESKTVGALFKYKYAGGTHYGLYLRALQLHKQQQRLLRLGGGGNGRQYRHLPGSEETTFIFEEEEALGASDGDDITTREPSFLDPLPTSVFSCETDPAMSGDAALTDKERRRGQKQQRQRRVRCTTDAMQLMCEEAQRYCRAMIVEEIRIVQPLVVALQQRVGQLQALGEAVALLDMLMSFATYSMLHACVRPCFVSLSHDGKGEEGNSDGAPSPSSSGAAAAALPAATSSWVEEEEGGNIDNRTAAAAAEVSLMSWGDSSKSSHSLPSRSTPSLVHLQHSRHPSARHSSSSYSRSGAAVPNTIQWPAGSRLLILTGPNTSGKTTLLRQTGQLFALAQSGCFIPASAASLFIADSIVAHMLCDDLPTVTQSSFKRELSELASVCHSATSRSLVLIDELGRSTTTTQGFTLAWATAQYFREKHTHTIMTTHFTGLTQLPQVYPDAANIHFATKTVTTQPSSVGAPPPSLTSAGRSVGRANEQRTVMKCTHQLLPGACEAREYGVALAAKLGLYPPVLEGALRLLKAEREAVLLPAPVRTENIFTAKESEEVVEAVQNETHFTNITAAEGTDAPKDTSQQL